MFVINLLLFRFMIMSRAMLEKARLRRSLQQTILREDHDGRMPRRLEFVMKMI